MGVIDAMTRLFAGDDDRGCTTTLSVANAFLALSEDGLVHMKAHKLVVLCDGLIMGRHERRLLDEGPEAWRLGPILATLYDEMSRFGGRVIVGPVRSRGRSGGPIADGRVRSAVAETWRRYGGLTPVELATICHAEGSPWKLTAADNDFVVRRGTRVDDRHTIAHFAGVLASEPSGRERRGRR